MLTLVENDKMNKIFQSVSASSMGQFRECIQFSIQSLRAHFGRRTKLKMEYHHIKALGIHIGV